MSSNIQSWTICRSQFTSFFYSDFVLPHFYLGNKIAALIRNIIEIIIQKQWHGSGERGWFYISSESDKK